MARDLKKLISEMTLEEKAGLLFGSGFLAYKGSRETGNSCSDGI
jgi:hypothetical protein